MVMMSVSVSGEEEVIKNGKFAIMATQQRRQLTQNVIVTGYLTKKSVGFYTYDNIIENGTILIQVNNDNKKCLDLYILKGT